MIIVTGTDPSDSMILYYVPVLDLYGKPDNTVIRNRVVYDNAMA